MKAVMLSVQPKWCELIASGKKTVEVRKTRPKLETPFKVYIYCTKNKKANALHLYTNSGYGRENFGTVGHWRSGKEIVDVNPHLPAYRYNAYLAEGKVIGEFVCDYIDMYGYDQAFDESMGCYINKFGYDITAPELERTCLSYKEFENYGNTQNLFGWHISDLVIYDEPKELREFFHACDKPKGTDCSVCLDRRENKCKEITRPPQSWFYLEIG